MGQAGDFSGSYIHNVRLFQSSLTNANFTNAYIVWNNTDSVQSQEATFVGANFTGAKFQGLGTVYKNDFSNANFTNADMHYSAPFVIPLPPALPGPGEQYPTPFGPITVGSSGPIDFSQSTFTGTIWSNTKCPDNSNSNDNGNTCVGHLTSL